MHVHLFDVAPHKLATRFLKEFVKAALGSAVDVPNG
jgi:hypothetical protein